MNKIAYIYNDIIINWSSIVIALAVVCAVCAAFALAVRRKGMASAVAVMLPIAMVLSLICSRVIHWYCRTDQYESLTQAFTDFSVGGFSIIGIFAGCLVAAVLVRAMGLTDSLGGLLDCVSPAAALGIAVGRLSFLFNYADRGKIFIENEEYMKLPLGSAVVNVTSGATEWRFATFFIQALVAALIFLIALALFFRFFTRMLKNGRTSDGNCFFFFIMSYFASEIILDSTRYDALFLRSNGFVSLMQIFAIVMVGLLLIYLSLQSVRFCGLKLWHFVLWALCLGGLGCAGYMEYYVQRHGNLYLISYSLMGAGLLIAVVCMLVLQKTTLTKKSIKAE